MDLFPSEKRTLQLPDAEIIYIPEFYKSTQANYYFSILKKSISWQQDKIKVYGKLYKQPRLTAFYGSSNRTYRYSGITMQPKPFTSELAQIKADIELFAAHKFTSVLLNLYRNGNDSNGWHADNEKALGVNPIIASLSLGQARWFHFKHRQLKDQRHKILLEHGSLLLMKGQMQQHWLHQIAKTKQVVDTRINLTFRTLKPL